MLEDQINGKNNSWAIRWNASAFLNNKLTLYPGRSLVQNIGHDNSGAHSGTNNFFDVELNNEEVNIDDIALVPSGLGYDAFKEYFLKINPPKKGIKNFFKKLISRLKG